MHRTSKQHARNTLKMHTHTHTNQPLTKKHNKLKQYNCFLFKNKHKQKTNHHNTNKQTTNNNHKILNARPKYHNLHPIIKKT